MRGITILVLLGVAQGGCSSVLAPQPDPSRFYLLTPVAVTDTGTVLADVSVALGPVRFPTYLQRTPLVTRATPNRLEIHEEQRWAEPLDENFARVLAENLILLLGTERIFMHPTRASGPPTYQIEMEVDRFEATRGSGVQLIARWLIEDGATRKVLFAGSSKVAKPSADGDHEAEVAALSAALADFARDIATEIRRLEEERPH